MPTLTIREGFVKEISAGERLLLKIYQFWAGAVPLERPSFNWAGDGGQIVDRVNCEPDAFHTEKASKASQRV
ncbi:hypothetical protein [Roseibium sp. M-1]